MFSLQYLSYGPKNPLGYLEQLYFDITQLSNYSNTASILVCQAADIVIQRPNLQTYGILFMMSKNMIYMVSYWWWVVSMTS